MSPPTVRLCHLYPDLMNIYADRGNIAVFDRRLIWRGLKLEVTEVSLGEPIDGEFDLYYLGGGQDRDQDLVAEDLQTKATHLRTAADAGAAQLYVCGGIQLAGHGYVATNGDRLPGTGVLDLESIAGSTRLIGDLVIDATIGGETHRVVGYENHAGRTVLGAACTPLGRVVHGHGNDGSSGFEGAIRDRVVGTYLHGPLLPKNPWLADIVLSWALEHRYGPRVELEPIDDRLETQARSTAEARAGVTR
ncbi:MAG: glutamine amidotransferase [Actinomycetota bacterium]